jgi:anti-sigma regulatory factor (Ser/Thr protein kinase)
MGPAVDDSSTARWLRSDLASVGAARDLTRDAFRDVDLDDAKLLDIQLAVSELVTNAVVHGGPGDITIDFSVADDAVSLSIASDGRNLPDIESWVVPVDGRRTGRGLSIVRAVADAVAVESDGDRIVVQCRFELG